MPDMMEHAKGIARQIEASRDQVRALTDHWATDGSHREELLRNLLRERLPPKCGIESGFVITPTEKSGQIDILIIDRDKPIVSRGADGYVFVTPDVVLGVIEVKSKLEGPKAFNDALTQLAKNASLCQHDEIWSGLFVFEQGGESSFFDGPDDAILSSLNEVHANTGVCIKTVSVGSDVFVRYWENAEFHVNGQVNGPAWHSYWLLDLAPAYFIGNFVAELTNVSDEYATVWFPVPGGKESMRRWYIAVGSTPSLFPEYEESSRVNGIHKVLKRAEKWEA